MEKISINCNVSSKVKNELSNSGLNEEDINHKIFDSLVNELKNFFVSLIADNSNLITLTKEDKPDSTEHRLILHLITQQDLNELKEVKNLIKNLSLDKEDNELILYKLNNIINK